MRCEECSAKAARTAAGPMMDGLDGPPGGAGGDVETRLSAIEERLAALEDANMASQMASLDALPVDISQYVNS